jgi:hypothetical protein
MKPHSFQINHGPAHSSQLIVREVMLVYEDTNAGLRAKLALEYLPQELKLVDDCSVTFWRQDLLSLPGLREQAALKACDADVIVIAIDDPSDTPEEIKDWLQRWLHHKGGGPSAVGILAGRELIGIPAENQPVGYIRTIAEAANAIFFCLIEPGEFCGAGIWQVQHSITRPVSGVSCEGKHGSICRGRKDEVKTKEIA